MRQIPQCPRSAIQFNSDLWEGLASRIRQMILTNSSESKVNWMLKLGSPAMRPRMIKSLGNLVYLHGDGVFDKSTEVCDNLFADRDIYARETSIDLRVFRDSHRMFGHEKVVSVLSNNQSMVEPIERSLRKAIIMLKEGAFVHHFEKFGVQKDDFLEAFMASEEIVANYKSLS